MTDEDLRRLLHDAVDDLEPPDRIGLIRSRARAVQPVGWRRRTAIGGVVLATAAAVGAIALLPSILDDGGATPVGPGVASGSTTASPAPQSEIAEPELADPQDPQSVPTYVVGDTPRGPRLYREFVVADGSSPRLLASLRALESTPGDPDYESLWPPGSFVGAEVDETSRLISVDLADDSPRGRPAGWDETRADLAVQQAVYTAQAAVGQGRIPVRFRVDGTLLDRVFGVPTSNPVTNAPVLDTLSLMSISSPFEGAEVKDAFTASGVSNGFEANVAWRLEDDSGDVVRRGSTTAEGWMGPRLFPWETEVDLSGLPAGGYTFVAVNEDPSGGTEGPGPDSDTRLVLVE